MNQNSVSEKTIDLHVESEIGRLRYVMVHHPGEEVANMIPEERKDLLFDDILDLRRARKEHDLFRSMLALIAPDPEDPGDYVLDPEKLLYDILGDRATRDDLIEDVCVLENSESAERLMKDMGPSELSKFLLTGESATRVYRSLEAFVDVHPFMLRPIPNLMFTCDSAVVVNRNVICCNMQYGARLREPLLMRYIFLKHPRFRGDANFQNGRFLFDKLDREKGLRKLRDQYEYRGYAPRSGDPQKDHDPERIEGGDVLRISSKTLFVGCGQRTTKRGIDRLVEGVRKLEGNEIEEIYAVILPVRRETIHLDTIFTMVDRRGCLVFAPLMLPRGERRVRVIRIEVPEQGSSSPPTITEEHDLISVLNDKLGNPGVEQTFYCGALQDEKSWSLIAMEREQWTDGANSLALRPGFILTYERNKITAEGFRSLGYEVFEPDSYLEDFSTMDVEGMRIKKEVYRQLKELFEDPDKKCVVLIPGQELSRARGGPRCMSMPLVRDSLN